MISSRKPVISVLFFLVFWISASMAQQPVINSFSPSSGPVGTLVTVAGNNLNNLTSFSIGGKSAITISNDGTTLIGMVMPGAVNGAVSVSTLGGTTSSATDFTIAIPKLPVMQQGNKMIGSGAAGAALQGYAVAVSADGSTAIVGGYQDNSNRGAAWIFVRNGNSWTEQARLIGTGALGSARQGFDVSISADGNTVALGGIGDNNFIGAAWIFVRNGNNWTEQAKLTGTGSTANTGLGYNVKLSADGNILLVTGFGDNSYTGAAWIFLRNGNVWSQQGAKFVGSGAIGKAQFGSSASISSDGNILAISGSADNNNVGATWIFARNGNSWSEQAKLIGTGAIGAAKQGSVVSLNADGTMLAVGGLRDNANIGATWIFVRTGTGWVQEAKIVATGAIGTSFQGCYESLSADGNTLAIGGYGDKNNLGAVWLFTRNGGVWTQQAKLVGTGVAVGQVAQGEACALSSDGSTLAIGGPLDNASAGATWFFTQAAQPAITSFSPSLGTVGTLITIAGNNLDYLTSCSIGGVPAIVISNDGTKLVAMVMPGAADGTISVATLGGSVSSVSDFRVMPSKLPLKQQGQKLLASGAVGNPALFSAALSSDGNTAVVGGIYDNNHVGGAWIFRRTGNIWAQESKLVGSGAIGSAQQGASVAISADGSTVAVGGFDDNGGVGAVWVFINTPAGWLQQGGKLVGSNSIRSSRQGEFISLSADGNTLAVGGPDDNSGTGATWVFTRNNGLWTEQAKLVRSGGGLFQGQSVALSADGNTLAIGDVGANNASGAVWILIRNGNGWVEQAVLSSVSDGVGAAELGQSVALSADGNTLAVGGWTDNRFVGATWVFIRNGNTWSQQGNKLVGNDIVDKAQQGVSVSISADGNTIVTGGSGDNFQMGAGWVFKRSGNIWSQAGPKLVGSDPVGNSFQGRMIAISSDGQTILMPGVKDNSFTGAAWVFVPASSNADLSDITLSSGTLSPAFTTATLSYTASVPNNINSITVTPVLTDPTATVTVNGSAPSTAVNLTTGLNTITIVVTAEDGTTTKTYTILVTRALSSNAYLSDLTLSSGNLNPSFSSANTSYTASVTNATTTVTVTPTLADATATVLVNGAAPSTPVSLVVGSNTINVVVTAQDGTTTKTYTITVTRAASSNADLSGLSASAGPLSPIFSAGVMAYTLNVPNGTASTTITPTVADATASVKVNAVPVTSGAASGPIALLVGANNIIVSVTAQDGSIKTYTVTVTRAPSSNANLSSLSLSSGALSPVFATNTMAYTASVSNNVTSIIVTPQLADNNATVTVNGGAQTTPIGLNTGNNTITVVVTAQDGVTQKIYTVIVNRAPSSNADLSNLLISNGVLTPGFGNAILDYTASVGSSVPNIRLTPTAADPTATITVNGVPVISGSASGSLTLAVGGPTTIMLDVIAQDGVTHKIYKVVITRTAGVATAFTPNGDGKNDVLMPLLDGIKKLHEFRVYNRYGKCLFLSNNPQYGWDGRYLGKMQPVDTYIYVVEGEDNNGKIVTVTGSISLLR